MSVENGKKGGAEMRKEADEEWNAVRRYYTKKAFGKENET